jgi:hypothetical protein
MKCQAQATACAPLSSAVRQHVVSAFLRRRTSEFRAWWHKPATTRDRVLGVFVGLFAGFWVGVLGRIILGEMPVSFATLAEFAMIGAGTGLVLGATFPKAVLILGFPFASMGVSS